ncbi:MAG: hypothetical protein ABI794_07950 [Betaproteobacteria bacterium]
MSLAALFVALGAAGAPASVELCYNYGCARQTIVALEDTVLDSVAHLFADVDSAASERVAIALALGMLARAASADAPVGADLGGNGLAESGVEGRMDCIDHSNNATRYLALMRDRGWLHFHDTGPRVLRMRYFVAAHWTATIRERATGADYSVDTWFRRNGYPAVVMPLADWRRGADWNE